MKVSRALGAALVSACAFANSTIAADEFEPLRRQLKSNGLSFYKPVNSVYGPGWLFTEQRDAQGNRFPRTICRNAYEGVPNATIDRNVIIASGTVTRTSDISFGLSLLEKLLKNLASATLGFKRAAIESAEITWGPVTLIELSDKVRADGSERQVSRSCALNVRAYLDDRNKFTQPVFLVQRSAAVRQLTYTFEQGKQTGAANDSSTGGNAKIDLKELASFTANVTVNRGAVLGFKVDVPGGESPVFIGANAVRVKTWENLRAANTQAKVTVDSAETADSSLFDQ